MSTKATTLNSKKSVGALVKDWMSLVGIAILIVVFSIISYVKFGAQYFLTWSNWKNILLQSSTVAIVALGQSIMLLTGNFDLSLGRMVCLTSCVGAILMKNVGMSTGLAILIMVRHRPCRRRSQRLHGLLCRRSRDDRNAWHAVHLLRPCKAADAGCADCQHAR